MVKVQRKQRNMCNFWSIKCTKLFDGTASVVNEKSSDRSRSGWSIENIALVTTNVGMVEDPATSICHRSQPLAFSTSSLQIILKKDLHLLPYKVQLTQELKPGDHAQRHTFVRWVLKNQKPKPDFVKKIIVFSDEARFHSNENQDVVHEKAMNPQ